MTARPLTVSGGAALYALLLRHPDGRARLTAIDGRIRPRLEADGYITVELTGRFDGDGTITVTDAGRRAVAAWTVACPVGAAAVEDVLR